MTSRQQVLQMIVDCETKIVAAEAAVKEAVIGMVNEARGAQGWVLAKGVERSANSVRGFSNSVCSWANALAAHSAELETHRDTRRTLLTLLGNMPIKN